MSTVRPVSSVQRTTKGRGGEGLNEVRELPRSAGVDLWMEVYTERHGLEIGRHSAQFYRPAAGRVQ